jgi:ATP-dependent Clp protease ATP-binding subunit ClpX
MPTTDQHCSFCLHAKNEVPDGRLIKGQEEGTYICADCAKGSSEIFLKEITREKRGEVALGKPKEIKAYLDRHIISQDRLKTTVATAVYHHFKRREASKMLKSGGVAIQKSNMLVLGPTGSGKTETFRAISRLLKVPFYVQDCSRLTQQGYVGDDADDMLRGLIQDASGDVARAEWGIILCDEADKIARKSGRSASGYRDITGEGVQQGLLRIIEGCKVPVTRGMGKNASVTTVGADGTVRSNVDVIDTTNILFVFAGSFAGIEEIVDRRVNKASRLGFGSQSNEKKRLSLDEAYRTVVPDDVLEFGYIPELLGRLPILTSTYELSEEDMVRVLTEPENAIVKQYKALFAMDDIALEFDNEALLAIGREAKKRPTGARSLRSIVEETLAPYAYNLPSEGDATGLRITAESICARGEAVVTRTERLLTHG